MVDAPEKFLQLIEALERRGISKDLIEESVTNISLHKVELIYWNDTDKERTLLHAFLLARTRSLLQESLATDLNFDGREIIEQYIQLIDEHFCRYQWPTDISEDDPLFLKQLWHQKNISINAMRAFSNDAIYAARIRKLKSESNHILRTLLKFPAIVSAQGECEPVVTLDLVTALQKSMDKPVKAVIEEELQARYPHAYDFLTALYGRRFIARLNQLLDLKK